MNQTQYPVGDQTTVLLLTGSEITRGVEPVSCRLDSNGTLVAEWNLHEIKGEISFRLRFLGPLAHASLRQISLTEFGQIKRLANSTNAFEWVEPAPGGVTVRTRKILRFFAGAGHGELCLKPQSICGPGGVIRLEVSLVGGARAVAAKNAADRRHMFQSRAKRALQRPDRLVVKGLSNYVFPRARKVFERLRGGLKPVNFSSFSGPNGWILVLSHTDPDNSMGGTEKYICEMREFAESRGLNVVVLSPVRRTDSFFKRGKKWLTLNADRRSQGIFPLRRLADALKKTPPTVIHIQHLRNWNLESLVHILGVSGSAPLYVHLHDFFALCPHAHVPCFNSERGALCQETVIPTTFHRCSNEFGESYLKKWNEEFRIILMKAERIYAPSEYVKSLYVRLFADLERKLEVLPHLRFEPKDVFPQAALPNCKLRLALLGYASALKGWAFWLSLLERPDLHARYEFFHIGGNPIDYAGQWVKVVSYSFHAGAKEQAVELLRREQIDVALLWSEVPESYSYTLQEAKAAGVPVLTSHLSGNLASCVRREGAVAGAVFASESELIQFLLDDARVRELIFHPRTAANLRYQPPPYLAEIAARPTPSPG